MEVNHGTGPSALQLWAGIECTLNRVNDSYFDQQEYSGHSRRIEDLKLIADLGVRALRQPVLWEHVERTPGHYDFARYDERVLRLKQLGIVPILGLLHHGSGPRHTSLIDPAFPEKFAHYAAAVAARYPWIDHYTPINEPLTTARFSGLYGHWYPHGRDDRTFVRAILNQCRATALAMTEIRRVNPGAKLVQTEDMGFTRSTPPLAYQADFDNARRWLSFDLLTGRVTLRHPCFNYLRANGAERGELALFERHPSAPDLLGLNYYVTSERFLDDRLDLYPPCLIGGNGRHHYADVEAVRVCASGLRGPEAVMLEAHERYGLPIAITEAHLGCSCDEQIRWLAYVFRSALSARSKGVDLRAVTAWAVLGSFGWDRLVTQPGGTYEPGVFELIDGRPRPTPVAEWLKRAAREGSYETEGGWWALPERLLYAAHESEACAA